LDCTVLLLLGTAGTAAATSGIACAAAAAATEPWLTAGKGFLLARPPGAAISAAGCPVVLDSDVDAKTVVEF
jgi:hypothetical protein